MFGIHTLLAVGLAFAFRLSLLALLVGAYVNNPWTFAPLYLVGTVLGCVLLGVPLHDGLPAEMFTQSGLAGSLTTRLRPYLWPYVVGNLVLGLLSGSVGYVVLRKILERRRTAAAGFRVSPVD